MASRCPAILRLSAAATAAAVALGLATPVFGETPTRDYFIGLWSFDGTCASGYGMGLSADGAAWFDEWGGGLWILDGGAIRMILQESEMGSDVVTGVRALTIEIEDVHKDDFTGRFVEDDDPMTATRCE